MADQPSLPMELILSIVDDRADATTIVCCTATCKLLRRHITSATFLSRLGPNHCTVGLFYSHPDVGLFCRYREDIPPGAPWYIPTPPSMPLPAFPRSFANLLHSYTPVASRNGLLVLRRYVPVCMQYAELCVCNPITDRRHFLPPPTVFDQRLALLTGGDGTSRSFRVVVADLPWITAAGWFRTQTFSSTAGTWGPVMTNFTPLYPMEFDIIAHDTIVLNSVLHWLCRSRSSYFVLTFHVDTAEVASIEIPNACVHQCVLGTAQDLILGSLGDRRLSLLVVEHLVLSIWILSHDKRWVRHKEIEWERILRSARSEVPLYRCHKIQLEWLGEKSGGVFLQMAGVGLLFLNLTTNEVTKIKGSKDIMAFRFCPYELDLVAQLSAMKTF